MTAAVALACDGGVILGADCCSSNSQMKMRSAVPKIVVRNGTGFGFTGSWRSCQIIAHHLDVPDPDRSSVERWLVTKLVPSVKSLLETHGYALHGDSIQDSGGHFVVAHRGVAAIVFSDYQVAIPAGGLCTAGSGGEVAYGAVRAATRLGQTPRQAVRIGIQVAAERVPSVSTPVRTRFVPD